MGIAGMTLRQAEGSGTGKCAGERRHRGATSGLGSYNADEVVVIVPALNEARHIGDCIRSLIATDPFAARCPIVVADGGSTDGTRAVVAEMTARHPNLKLVDNPGRLQAAAVNLALGPLGEGRRFLVRCDAHAVYPAGYVSRLLDAIEAQDASSVVVPMDAVAGPGCFARAVAWIVDTPLGAGGAAHRGGRRSGPVDHGHHAAFRMESFRGLGGYDESFATNEDAEYDRRLLAAGGRIWLEASIRVGYVPRAHPGALWRQYRRYGDGRARTCLKHRAMPRARQVIPAVNLVLLVASILAAPFTPLGFVWPAVYLAALAGASAWMALRHGSACGLLAGPALAIMHLAWAIGFLGRLALGARRAQ